MTVAPPDQEPPVSRARYNRERRAREQAEELLEEKSRALFDANRALVAEAEALRRALIKVEDLRVRKQTALRAQSVLYDVLDGVASAKTPGAGLRALLDVVLNRITCDAVAVVEDTDGGAGLIGVVVAEPADLTGLSLPATPDLLRRARRLPDLARAAWSAPLPDLILPYHSLMLAPLRIEGERPLAVLCLSRAVAQFSADDLALLERVAQVAANPLGSLRLSQRNAALAALIEGTPQPDDATPSGIDVPFQSVNRAFARLTKAQALTVDILNDLLTAPSAGVDRAIQRALARLGQDIGSDRTFLLDPSAASGGPTYQWNRLSSPRALPDLKTVLPRLHAGIEVLIDSDSPDIAARTLLVPALTDGQLTAVLGHALPDTSRTFLPGEVHLLRSVGHAVHAVLRRTEAEAESRLATEALATERNRLALTLSALPDLLLELDAEGRFTDYHSGGIHVSQALVSRFHGFALEQALPPDLAAIGRGILTELATTGQAEPQVVQFDFGNGARWLHVNAVARGRDSTGAPAGYLLVLRDVTRERTQAQEIARLSEVARRTTNLVLVTDAQRRITWVNAAFEASTGWTLAEVKGLNPGQFLKSERSDPATQAILRKALDAGEPVQVELLNVTRWGAEYWIYIDIQPLRDEQGVLSGFMAVQTDITVSKAQEAALEQAAAEAERARARLAAAVDALQDGFALYDADDRLVLCNDRYREIYPLSAPAMVPGTRFEDILRQGLDAGEYLDGVGREEEWLAERLAAHRTLENQAEQRLKDGRWLRVYERATPDGGRVGLRVDITALKEAEARALADRSAAMDVSLDAIAITDAQGAFLYANPAYATLTRATGSLTGRTWHSLFAPDMVQSLRRRVLPKLERDGTWQGDVAGALTDGTVVDLDISMTRRPDGAVLWIMRDLSERHRAESERNRLREELQLAQRREVIGQLSAGLAHDFNNLIAAIAGSASLISTESGPQATERIHGHAARIQRAADQAEALVRRLLALGTRSNQRRTVDLAACLREAADLLRPGLPKSLRLVLDLPDQALLAEADPTDILQMVLNLGLNARDAMAGHPAPPGGHVLTLALRPGPGPAETEVYHLGSLQPDCAHACISMTDTGPGLDAAAAVRAFSPYFTSKGDKGSGLGLGIVQGIILAAQGALGLSRGPQGGARFVLRWPLTGPDAAEAAGTSPAPPASTPTASDASGPDLPQLAGAQLDRPQLDRPQLDGPLLAGPHLTGPLLAGPARSLPGRAAAAARTARLDGRVLLLVDDAEDVLAVWTSILEKAGAEVAPSSEPADILEVLSDDPTAFDLLVTDFDMPGMTGADLARAAHLLRPDLPVVLVTALPDWRGRDRAGAADPKFAAVLTKPVTAQALVAGALGALGSREPKPGA